MSKDIRRRSFLQGSVALPVVLPLVTLGPVPQTSIITLTNLASEGKFLSSDLKIPGDVSTGNWHFFLDGVPVKDTPYGNRFLKEIYAPGNESGYVVMYLDKDKNGRRSPETEVIHGNWSYRDMPETA